jgi:hypothetical protein
MKPVCSAFPRSDLAILSNYSAATVEHAGDLDAYIPRLITESRVKTGLYGRFFALLTRAEFRIRPSRQRGS